MTIGAVVQARTSSTRLPQKVLKELPLGSGITVLQQVIRRLRRAEKINEIIVATSEEESDDAIVTVAQREGVKYFRGSLTDVLERYYQAAKENGLDVVVRITADCPCVDSQIVDQVIEKHLDGKGDFTANTIKRSYPVGLDVEVFSFKILEEIYRKATQPDEREHVTVYIYKHQRDFKVINVEADQRLYAPQKRITLDTPEDYTLLCAIFDALYPADKYFSADAIMRLFEENPRLDQINTQHRESGIKR